MGMIELAHANVPLSLTNYGDNQLGQHLGRSNTTHADGNAGLVNSLVPTGASGLLVANFVVNDVLTSPPVYSYDLTFPYVLLFGPASGRRFGVLTVQFGVDGSFGAREWTLTAELGTKLADVAPDPPLATFSKVGSSNNQNPIVSVSLPTVFIVNFDAAQAQARLTHDGAQDIPIDWIDASFFDVGQGSGQEIQP